MSSKYAYCVAAVAVILLTASLQAQSSYADQNYKRGVELFEAQKFAAAAAELQKAQERDPNSSLSMQIEYMLAMCAVENSDRRAEEILSEFIAKYPNSIYHNDIRISMAEIKYERADYDGAQRDFLTVNPFELSRDRLNSYNFKAGHTLFMLNQDDKAYTYLRQVDSNSEFGPHSTYYINYIDYVNGNYEAAKKGFSTLLANESYTPIIPFYLLQIEFLQDNYSYVVENGDKLIAAAKPPRNIEIMRLVSESWYHLKDYRRALAYMEAYQSGGGQIEREENYIIGYSNYMEGDYRAAADALSQACAADDDLSQNASYHLADSYLKLGDKLSAMKSFSIASAGNSSPAIKEDALFNYGKLQYELGGSVFNEAINILQRYIEEYPKSPRVDQAREYLLAAYYNSRNYEAAYQAIEQIPNPDNNVKTAMQKITYFRALEHLKQGEIDMADKLLALSMQNRFNPKYTALTTFWQGEILFRRGKFKEAIPLFNSYIRLSPESEPEHPMAYYNMAYCNFNLKRWSEATAAYNKFISLYRTKDNFTADAYNRLGDIAYAERSFWRAIELYDDAVKQSTPERYYAAYQRAMVLGMINRPQRKIESLQRIITENKGEYVGDAMYELGRTYTSQEQFSEAASALKDFVSKYPNSPKTISAIADLGLIYQNLGDSEQALRYYKMAVTKSPSSPQGRDALEGIKGIYVDMNDVDGYFSFARSTGIETDKMLIEKDSLSFAAAQKIYLSGSSERGSAAMTTYLKNYPNGTYRAAALFYGGECAQRANDLVQAENLFTELTQMYYNDYTVQGLERLSALLYQDKRYQDAGAAYKKLSETATNPVVIVAALQGAVKCAVEVGDTQNIIAVANHAIASPFADHNTLRTARFAKANALKTEGSSEEAISLYKVLSSETTSVEGAESAYNVIEYQFTSGDSKAAEDLVMSFSDSNSPHSYWVGKAFIILGDIYAQKGDSFQARATYQSIIDGYTPLDDGVVDQAKERIKGLK